MKIGIDISQIAYEGTGVARFTKGLVKAILDNDTENEWIFFFSSLRNRLDGEILSQIKKRGFKLIRWKFPPSLLSFLWNDLHILSPDFSLGKLDFFITSDWTEPPSKSKKATIVHDLVFKRYPETVDIKIIKTQNKRFRLIKNESRIILADSNATKKDLIEIGGIEQERIKVIYPGVDIQRPPLEEITGTLKKFDLQKPFILSVGKIEPRKNIKRLIEAYLMLDNRNIDLVLVGPKGWGDFNTITIKQYGNRNNIHYLGLISDSELYSLMSSCFIFAYPSIWEGFGLPVAEAMKLGVPVCTSNTSSLKEIASGAAALFNPFSVKDISEVLKNLLTDENLRKKLISSGKSISKQFDWKNYYNLLIELIKSYT